MSVRATLSVIIPAFNEAANILGTLGNVSAALESTGIDAEIIVIDDGSTDRTAANAVDVYYTLRRLRAITR